MQLQKESLTPLTLAIFDSENFDEHHAMDAAEWRQMLSNGYVAMYTARNDAGELAAVLALKTASVNVGLWYLHSVAVSEKYRKMRLGTRLFNEAIENEIAVGLINSHCHIDNKASITFHKSLGFKVVQYVPDFYDDCEDGILWSKLL
jgi:ribosomal protein S18 acetylase RimI-like enzyme